MAQQLARTQDAIDGARERLTGGFQDDSEYNDLRASLDKLVTDKPILEAKLDNAQYTLTDCKSFLDALPDDVELTPVAPVKPNGYDLHSVRRRIADAEEEIAKLRAVPVLSADIKSRVQEYVAALARPKITGTATGVSALMKEIERQANTPMPLDRRKRRIAELKAEVDTLQRQSLALGDSSALPPEVILGVRVVKREPAKRVSAA